MPAISEDKLSSADKKDTDHPVPSSLSLDKKRRTRETTPTLIDRVVQQNKQYAVPSPYGDTYNEQEEEVIEEWTTLTAREGDETSSLIEQVHNNVCVCVCACKRESVFECVCGIA